MDNLKSFKKKSEYIKLVFKIKSKLNILFSKKNSLRYSTKKDFQIDPVTKLDISAEKIIRKEISQIYPDHNIKGEELKNKNKSSKFTWIIDPIDGTKSLILGLPTWSCLIGLYYESKCILSFAYFPILNKVYLAYENKSYLFENKIKKVLKCNKNCKIKDMKLAINTLHSLRSKRVLEFIMNFKGFFKVTGVDAYNFCMISEGKYDVLVESGLKLVDILPIVLIVKNSGAIITDWNGGENFNLGKIIVAPNKKIHSYFIKILKAY